MADLRHSLFALFAILCLAAAAPVTVGSKLDSESALLGAIIVESLSAHGIPVDNKIRLGPTQIVRSALLSGAIDIYPEYTGNGAYFHHRVDDPVWKNAAAGWKQAQALDRDMGLEWLAPAPANRGWAIAVRQDLATAQDIPDLSAFARWVAGGGAVKLAASAEFVESPAALPAFEQTYGFTLSSGQMLVLAGGDTALTLKAAAERISGVNTAMAYGTDGAAAALGLVILDDDRHAQIIYEPAPVIRRAVLDRHPEIRAILDPIFEGLDAATLRRLNGKITLDGEAAEEVAAAYLKAKK